MFRLDKCTIKRPTKTKVNGEVIYTEPTTVYADIPCHLSVKTISAVNQSSSTAKVLLDFVLFVDTATGVKIEPNDIVEVTTGENQNYYELRAGESKVYPLTIQTHCEVDSVV